MTGLALVVLLACAHAAAHALLRPLYQVSDEVVYLSTVQAAAALAATPERRQCLAPPDGRFPQMAASTKPGFLWTTSGELRVICAAGFPGAPLTWLRLLQSLSLGVVAGCAWAIARLVTGQDADAMLAGVLVAAHPVAATYAGGVTPDGWANAFSAVALLAGTRVLLEQAQRWDLPVLVVSALAAFAWKDTTAFVLLLPVMVLGTRLWRLRGATSGRWGPLASVTAVSALLATAGMLWFRTPYLAAYRATGGDRAETWSASRLLGGIVDDLLAQAGQLVSSSWTGLGNFGASTLGASATATMLGGVLLIAGGVGALRRGTAHPGRLRPLLATWSACAVICVLQPSIRQVLLGSQDIHQGRWLLPLLAPGAVMVGYGLHGLWGLGARALPLWTLAVLTAAGSGLLETARFFWESYPANLRESALYIRGTGGGVLDDALVLSLIRHGAATAPHVLPLLFFLLLSLSAASLWYGAGLSAQGRHVRTHDR